MYKHKGYIQCPLCLFLIKTVNPILKDHKMSTTLINFKIEKDMLFGYDTFYAANIIVAIVHHETKEIRSTKGFFLPHPFAKKSKRYAKRLGYVFNEII